MLGALTSVGAGALAGQTLPTEYPLMRFTETERQLLAAEHLGAPRTFQSTAKAMDFPTSLSLLSRLPYVPAERNQGSCANCWAWPGTGIMEIANDVQTGIHDRLSLQFLNSCNTTSGCCEGLRHPLVKRQRELAKRKRLVYKCALRDHQHQPVLPDHVDQRSDDRDPRRRAYTSRCQHQGSA